MPDKNAPTVILGGGFTGLFTALHLSHMHYTRPVYLLDKEENFAFKPLLYELLSGEMDSHQVIPRYEELLEGNAVRFVHGMVSAVDLLGRRVLLTSGLSYAYGNLVLALGSCAGYFGVEGAREHSFAFRTGDDVLALKRHLRECLQRAGQAEDSTERRRLLTVAVVGAGPSGLELASTLADWLPGRYRQLGGDGSEIRIVLLHRGSEILQGDMNYNLRWTVHQSLPRRVVPIELEVETQVIAVRPDGLTLNVRGTSEDLPAATCIWTAGTQAHPLLKTLVPEEQRDKRGQLRVNPTLQLPTFPEVFAGGDCAIDAEKPLPAIAQVAYQQGYAIARNLKAIAEGHSPVAAEVHLRGTLMKLGIGEAAAELYDRYEIKGHLGHLLRQVRYLELLPTPIHNFKATTEWLTDAIFHRMEAAQSGHPDHDV